MARNKKMGSLAEIDSFLAGSSERQDRAMLNEIAPSPKHLNVFSRGEATNEPECRNPVSFCSPPEQPGR